MPSKKQPSSKKRSSRTAGEEKEPRARKSLAERDVAKTSKAPNVSEKFYYIPTTKIGSATPWWDPKLEFEDRWKNLYDTVCTLKANQGGRYLQFRRYMSIYEYGYKADMTATSRHKQADDGTLMAGNRAFNVIRTIIADAFSQEVAPQLYTEGGTISERELAEDATNAVQSVLDECNYRQLEEEIFVDALSSSGCGFLKIYPDFANGAVCMERVIPLDFMVDDAECRNSDPRTVFVRYNSDKAQLAAYFDCEGDEDAIKPTFGEMTEALEAVASANWGDNDTDRNLDDSSRVEVWESIHLPSRYIEQPDEESEASADGAHIVAVNGKTLYYDKWENRKFNIVVARPLRSRVGFWGVPMMRFLAPIQRELEVWDMRMQRGMRKNGAVQIAVQKGSKLNVRHLTNDSGTVFEYEGTPPTEFTTAAFHPQILQWGDTLENRMMRWSGQNNMSATGEIPAGLSHVSGKALTTVLDTGSRVNAYVLRERERLIVEVADRIIDAVAALVEYNADYAARYVKGQGYRVIKWKNIVEARERIVIRCKPINALSTHPTAKLAQATELLQVQAIPVDEWRRITRIGDVAANEMLSLAPRDVIEKLLDSMVETGVYKPPRPYFNLDLCLEMGTNYYCMLLVQRPDDDAVLDLLDRWCTDTAAMQQQAKPPAPAPMDPMAAMMGGGPPGAPPGMPGAPPGMPPMMPPGGMPPGGPMQ